MDARDSDPTCSIVHRDPHEVEQALIALRSVLLDQGDADSRKLADGALHLKSAYIGMRLPLAAEWLLVETRNLVALLTEVSAKVEDSYGAIYTPSSWVLALKQLARERSEDVTDTTP